MRDRDKPYHPVPDGAEYDGISNYQHTVIEMAKKYPQDASSDDIAKCAVLDADAIWDALEDVKR